MNTDKITIGDTTYELTEHQVATLQRAVENLYRPPVVRKSVTEIAEEVSNDLHVPEFPITMFHKFEPLTVEVEPELVHINVQFVYSGYCYTSNEPTGIGLHANNTKVTAKMLKQSKFMKYVGDKHLFDVRKYLQNEHGGEVTAHVDYIKAMVRADVTDWKTDIVGRILAIEPQVDEYQINRLLDILEKRLPKGFRER